MFNREVRYLSESFRKPDEVDVKFTKASITSYQDSERYRTSLCAWIVSTKIRTSIE